MPMTSRLHVHLARTYVGAMIAAGAVLLAALLADQGGYVTGYAPLAIAALALGVVIGELVPVKDKPYIFAKSGSLSNNNTLSGYLITKKDRVLIFSFMNANFTVPADEVRQMMQEILVTVRNEY